MLVVVHDRNVEGFLQTLLDIEALRCLDVLEVDATKGGGNALYSFAELLWVFLVDLDVEDVDAAINFEKQSLTFHNRLAAHSTDIAQAQYGCSIADDCHQIAFIGIFIRIVGVLLNFQTGVGDTWRIGQRKVCLCTIGLGRLYFNFSWTASFVIGQSCFFRDLNHFVLCVLLILFRENFSQK